MKWFRLRRKKAGTDHTEPTLAPGSSAMARCGHEYVREDVEVTVFGKKVTLTFNPKIEGTPRYCPECFAALAIRCAWCGEVIWIGDPVTLYTPNDDFVPPDYAVVYGEGPQCFVGCLGWDCADSGVDRAGFWMVNSATGKGYVHRVASPLELVLSAERGVIINDLSNPTEEPTFF